MCGIFAVVHRGRPVNPAALTAAIGSQRHRGPDAQGTSIRDIRDDRATYQVGLAHRRLAIIDLDRRSNQPFIRNGAATIFNGEIYNFRDLKGHYQDRTTFCTSGDTELLHEALRLEGVEAIRTFNGQWAFVQHKDRDARLVLGRDMFGKKPLFHFRSEDTFIVSSTITAISSYLGRALRFDRNFLNAFMFHALAPAGDNSTGYEEIGQLRPGCAGVFDFASWTLAETPISDRSMPATAAMPTAPLHECIQDAVLRRLISDRPIGLLLSGGVNSTLILSVLHANKRLGEVTCIVGDTGASDDARFGLEAARTAGIEARVVKVDYRRDAFDTFLRVCSNQERPFRLQGNMLAIPQLYSAVAETDIKVVLDGTGADEMFGGYWDRQFPYAIREAVRQGRFGWLAGMALANRNEFRRFMFAVRVAAKGVLDPMDPELRTLAAGCGANIPSLDPLARLDKSFSEALVADIFRGRLQDWLWQNDRNAMTYSIEARSPFMDRDLFPHVFTGYDKKFSRAFNKLELRKAFSNFLPLPTQWRRQKQGFRWSFSTFLNENWGNVFELCTSSPILSEMFPDLVEKLKTGSRFSTEAIEKMTSIAGVERTIDAR